MKRFFRPSLTLHSMLLLCIGTFTFAGDPSSRPHTDARSPTEELRMLEEKIQHTAEKAHKEEDPKKRELLKQMIGKLEEVKSYKAQEVHGKLRKPDRKIMNAAYQEYRALKDQMKGLPSAPDKPKPQEQVAQNKKNPATYETASGFKVRLRIMD